MSAWYQPYKEKCLDSSAPDLSSVDLRLVAVDAADYTIDLANHEFLDDVPSGARVATSSQLQTVVVTGGVLDADDMAPGFTGVTGDPFEYIILKTETGNEATDVLILIWDSGTGLPLTPNTGDVNVTFDSGPNKVGAL